MKQKIKKWLKKYPFIFKSVQKMYRTVFAPPIAYSPLQRSLLENLNNKKLVSFIQVGSNDGIQGDPLHELIVANKKWKGLLIEPVDFLFERLKANYGNSERFIFINKAIASTSGNLEFFYVSEQAKAELGDSLPYWYDQLGSFDRNHILKHLDGMLEPFIISKEIRSVRLQELVDKHDMQKVDLIHIDAEGYDYNVLLTIDFERCKPSIILYEHKHLSNAERKSAESLLMKNGYDCAHYGSDTLALLDA